MMIASCESQWSYGVTVSTLDSESSDRGSNPRRTFFCSLAAAHEHCQGRFWARRAWCGQGRRFRGRTEASGNPRKSTAFLAVLATIPELLAVQTRREAGGEGNGTGSRRAVLGIEPRTSRTRSENHATRPNSHVLLHSSKLYWRRGHDARRRGTTG